DHYAPLGPTDDVPTSPLSVAVALADKLDTLTGFWAINEKPTGSKDPYALRRAALGVIRIVLDNNLRLSLFSAFEPALEALFKNIDEVTIDKKRKQGGDIFHSRARQIVEIDGREMDSCLVDLLSFFHDRLKVYLRDRNIPHDVIDACLAMPGNDDLRLVVNRAEALAEVLATEDGENLLQGFKRANNILAQAEEADGVEYSFGADLKFAEHQTEKDLFAALESADAKIQPALADEDFRTAMSAMAALRPHVDAFFEAVQVNSDNQVLRRNRLNMLSRIRSVCAQVADLRLIGG
ncbi:MAG: glycine--tRNA ligase subunit beta, partial [Pseudomonadota bacterium]